MTTKEKTPTLYDLSEDLEALKEDLAIWAEDHDGDISEYPLERIDKLEGEVKDKVLKCAQLYKEWKAKEKIIAEEEKALRARKQAHGNRGDRLKAYMESALPPNAKFEDARSAVSWKNNPPAVEVLVPVDQLPTKYQVIERHADKLAIKADMVEAEIQVVDGLGEPQFTTKGEPMMEKVLQVTWPMPSGEMRPKPGLQVVTDLDDVEMEPVLEDRVIARMKQGRSLLIR